MNIFQFFKLIIARRWSITHLDLKLTRNMAVPLKQGRNMKKKMMILSFLAAFNTFAQDDISLGEAGYGGNGCPAGSASVTLSPDAKALSIIFDQFVTEAGQSSGRTIDRKSCNIAVPVHVPQGYAVSIISVDYRGFVSLPSPQAQARFQTEYFFAGSNGPRFVRDFRGRQDSDYTINNKLAVQSLVWSACGASVNLRVNASMMLRNSSYQDAMATVDSVDMNAGIIYQLQWRRCR